MCFSARYTNSVLLSHNACPYGHDLRAAMHSRGRLPSLSLSNRRSAHSTAPDDARPLFSPCSVLCACRLWQQDEPDEKGEIEVDVDKVFGDCIDEVESSGDTKATEATAEFLQSMLGPESKVPTITHGRGWSAALEREGGLLERRVALNCSDDGRAG